MVNNTATANNTSAAEPKKEVKNDDAPAKKQETKATASKETKVRRNVDSKVHAAVGKFEDAVKGRHRADRRTADDVLQQDVDDAREELYRVIEDFRVS